jgi:decaprenylphospho-beta-D-ribofuranose 2-oxidase
LTAASRARLGLPVWTRSTSRLLGVSFAFMERLRPRSEVLLFDALFPFARRGEYLLLYGRRGLAEYQTLVPLAAATEFLRALARETLRFRAPVVMGSMKLFRGERGLLRFEDDGVCVTLDLVRSPDGIRFLERLDRLTLDFAGLPHIIKDSRLPAEVVARSYPGHAAFRELRNSFDPEAVFRSELSTRLAL